MVTSCESVCLSWRTSLSVPLVPDVELSELTPLVAEKFEMVLAALEPTASLPLLANGRSEFWISSMAFWW